jgi:hypothetical protein
LKDGLPESRERARAQFYQAAARLMLDANPGATGDLLSLPAAGLDQKDRNLLAAVRRVASALDTEVSAAALAKQGTIEPDENDPGKRVIAAAEAAILRADAIRRADEAQIP